MARFFLGHTTGGARLERPSSYPYVDLRGKIPGNPTPNQGQSFKDSGVVFHWNGPKVLHDDLNQLRIDADFHMRVDWGGGGSPARANGVQYEWAIGQDGTKYRLRDPGANLWHCGNSHHNYHSFAVTFLIGQGQRPSAAAKASAAELADALLEIQGLGREHCYGHRDVNASECPGTAYTDFVLPYRKGAKFEKTSRKEPRPSKDRDLYIVQAGAFEDPNGAERLAARLRAKGFPTHIATRTGRDGTLHRVQTGAFRNLAGARATEKKVRAAGFDAIIVNEGTPAARPPDPKPEPHVPGTKPYRPKKGQRLPGNDPYSLAHPTTFDFRPDVKAQVDYYEDLYWGLIFINTYRGHPGGEANSYDVWDDIGRGYPLDPVLGDKVLATIFNDPSEPYIRYAIYKGYIWTPAYGWQVYTLAVPGSDWRHDHHIHITTYL